MNALAEFQKAKDALLAEYNTKKAELEVLQNQLIEVGALKAPRSAQEIVNSGVTTTYSPARKEIIKPILLDIVPKGKEKALTMNEIKINPILTAKFKEMGFAEVPNGIAAQVKELFQSVGKATGTKYYQK